MNKKIIKSMIFLFIFLVLFYIIYHILWLRPTTISYFYKEPKDSLDIVYIGASNVSNHYNTVLAYEKYGYTTGILSTGSQSFVLAKYLIQEAEIYQNPSLYIIDIAKAADDFNSISDGNIRYVTDSMKSSQNRIDAINEVLSYKKNIDKKEYVNWYFSFLMYHNSWKHISKNNFVGDQTLYKGYLFDKETIPVQPQNTYHWSEEILELQEENKQVLINLINHIKINNINVLFVVPKRYFEEDANKRLNDVIRILKENDLDVINFNILEDFNNMIDFNTDYYNSTHLNIYGATKYTLYFSKYLKENYELKDHRNNENYFTWDSEYKRFKLDYNKLTNKDFNELLLEYSKLYR